MAQVFLNAGDKFTTLSGAIMTVGPKGSVIGSQMDWGSVKSDFCMPTNPRRTSEPFGFIELSENNGNGEFTHAFDVYLDYDTNNLWFNDRIGYVLTERDIRPGPSRQPPELSAKAKGKPEKSKSGFSKAIAWLMKGNSSQYAGSLKTLDYAKQVAEGSGLKVIAADRLEMALVDKLWRDDALLLNTVLSMLSTRVRAGEQSQIHEQFEPQLSELDKHVGALSLYEFARGQITDLPYPRESIESLMKLPKLVDQIFSDSGYSTTVYLPLPIRDPLLMLGLRSFAQRTGLTLEVVIDRNLA